jgi:hypothetical protein
MVSEEAHAAVVAENAQLRARIALLEAALARALERVGALEAAGKGPPPFVKANVAEQAPKERAKRAPEHNRGRRREAPTRVVEHRIERCPACRGALSGLTLARVRQVVDLPPPPPVEVTEHRVYRGWCSYCRAWRAAPLDLGGEALGRGRLGVRLGARVAQLRARQRLPIRAIQRELADVHGLRVSAGALVDLLHRVAARGAGAAGAILERVRRRAVVHGDETPWREAGRNGYIWALGSPEGERYFEHHHSRAGAVPNRMLGDGFAGVLVSDFYAAYNDTPGGRHQRCWAHLLRDVHQLAQAHPDDAEVVGWTDRLKAVWEQVRAAATGPPEAAARRATADALLGELRALGAAYVERPGHPCRALAWRLWYFQDELLTCVRQAGVPADNNAAERMLRPQAVARKISGGTRSPRGSHTRMALSTLFDTWAAHGLDPLAECLRLLQSPLPQA